MRVLILGQAKSGTTALHRSVSDALPGCVEVFEPDDLRTVDADAPTLVAKHLFESFSLDEVSAFDAFDKRLFLVRDPRDRLISLLLYDLYSRSFAGDTAAVEKFLDALRAKEAKPESMPVLKLMHVYWKVSGIDLLTSFTVSNRRITDFWRRYGERFHLVRYESMVAGDLTAASSYLGVDLAPATLEGPLTRVVRSSTSGTWRHWFARQDLNAFQPMCVTVLRQFGYTDIDWSLAEDRVIDPATSSEYVAGLARRWVEEHP